MKSNIPSHVAALAILASGMMVAAQESARPAPDKPNILVIFTDDHGWADLGAHGVDADIRTPHFDQLARDGVLCKRGYVTSPQCTPSRAGLMSGRYQQRLNVAENGRALAPEVVTLPERLKAAGYTTGISGKWHLDMESREDDGSKPAARPDCAPWAQGFDEYFTGFLQDYAASHALDGTPYPDAPRNVHEQGCRVEIQTRAALSFLERRAQNPQQPWFLYLAWMAPHTPLEWPEPWISQVPEGLPRQRRSALALIAAMDDGLGRIREKLRAQGQEKNTLIFLIGDNGAPLPPANPKERNPWDGSLNLPMKGQKGMVAEGGIRVPFVTAWPGRIPGGQVYDHPVISLDVAATSIAAAGLPVAPELDGVNLLPFLDGSNAAAPHESLYWLWSSQAAIQEFPWKFVLIGQNQRLLFDITGPEGENLERNLIEKHPEIAARLEKKLRAWAETLQPPGIRPVATAFDRRHAGLFIPHGIIDRVVAEEPAP